jgi:adenosylhomocysteine nucleosidase
VGGIAATGLLGCVLTAAADVNISSQAATSRVAIITAFDLELAAMLEHLENSDRLEIAGQTHYLGQIGGQDVVVVRSGRSLVAGAATSQAIIDHHSVKAIVVAGIAGGVNPGLRVADVTVPRRWAQYQEHVMARQTADGLEVGRRRRGSNFDGFGIMVPRPQRLTYVDGGKEVDENKFWFEVDPTLFKVAEQIARSAELDNCMEPGDCLPHTPKIVTDGYGVSGNGFIDNADYREWIWRNFEASAVDQETAAIAQVAYTNRVPYIAFRALSDLAGGRAEGNQALQIGPLAADNAAVAVVAFLEGWGQSGDRSR